MKAFNTISRFLVAVFFLALLTGINACKKEKEIIYDVNDVQVEQEGGVKNNVKSTEEFISIAYSDLYGQEISNSNLQKLNLAYSAFGDNKLIEDMVIRNFLKDPALVLPSKQSMTADPAAFVTATYKKFLNRQPNEFENYYLTKIIVEDTSVAPANFYYTLMTSNEYRYY
jgi:hypothetical protein